MGDTHAISFVWQPLYSGSFFFKLVISIKSNHA